MRDKAKIALALCDHRFLERDGEGQAICRPAFERIVPLGRRRARISSA